MNNKETLNFILEEPTHLKYIDATMALHNYGAQHLISNPACTGIIEPPTELEGRLLEITREHGIIGNEMDTLYI